MFTVFFFHEILEHGNIKKSGAEFLLAGIFLISITLNWMANAFVHVYFNIRSLLTRAEKSSKIIGLEFVKYTINDYCATGLENNLSSYPNCNS